MISLSLSRYIYIYTYIYIYCCCSSGRAFSPTVWPGIECECPADAPCASEADTALAAIVDLVCPQVLHTVPTPIPEGIEGLRKTTKHTLGRKGASENGNGKKDQVSTEAGATQVAPAPAGADRTSIRRQKPGEAASRNLPGHGGFCRGARLRIQLQVRPGVDECKCDRSRPYLRKRQ